MRQACATAVIRTAVLQSAAQPLEIVKRGDGLVSATSHKTGTCLDYRLLRSD